MPHTPEQHGLLPTRLQAELQSMLVELDAVSSWHDGHEITPPIFLSVWSHVDVPYIMYVSFFDVVEVDVAATCGSISHKLAFE